MITLKGFTIYAQGAMDVFAFRIISENEDVGEGRLYSNGNLMCTTNGGAALNHASWVMVKRLASRIMRTE